MKSKKTRKKVKRKPSQEEIDKVFALLTVDEIMALLRKKMEGIVSNVIKEYNKWDSTKNKKR